MATQTTTNENIRLDRSIDIPDRERSEIEAKWILRGTDRGTGALARKTQLAEDIVAVLTHCRFQMNFFSAFSSQTSHKSPQYHLQTRLPGQLTFSYC